MYHVYSSSDNIQQSLHELVIDGDMYLYKRILNMIYNNIEISTDQVYCTTRRVVVV